MVGVRRSERNNTECGDYKQFSEFDVHQIAYFLAISVSMNNFMLLQLILSPPLSRIQIMTPEETFSEVDSNISTYTILLPKWSSFKAL
jgi:hypothetical protein